MEHKPNGDRWSAAAPGLHADRFRKQIAKLRLLTTRQPAVSIAPIETRTTARGRAGPAWCASDRWRRVADAGAAADWGWRRAGGTGRW